MLFLHYHVKSIEGEINIHHSTVEEINIKLDKQKWFFDEHLKIYDLEDSAYPTYESLWERFSVLQKEDSLTYKWNKTFKPEHKALIYEMGIQNPEELNLFISDNSLSKSEKDNLAKANTATQSLKIKLLEEREKLLGLESRFNLALASFILAAVLAFPVRFLIYSIQWSIKTLKAAE